MMKSSFNANVINVCQNDEVQIKSHRGKRFSPPPKLGSEESQSHAPQDLVSQAKEGPQEKRLSQTLAAVAALALTLGSQAAQASTAVEMATETDGPALDTDNDHRHDGVFVSAKGAESNQSNPYTLEAVEPNNGKVADETVFLVNGIMTDLKLQRADMQALANTGKRVVGIHNSTEGLFTDLAQCVSDKLSFESSDNKATNTAVDLLYNAVQKGEPIHAVGHSQGALILSSALSIVKHRMMEAGQTEAQVEAALSNVKITTFGGAAQNYPDGPSYTHVVNKKDLVPMGSGVGLMGHPGKGAVIHTVDVTAEPTDMPELREGVQNWFARYVDRTSHGPQDIYFNHAPWNNQ